MGSTGSIPFAAPLESAESIPLVAESIPLVASSLILLVLIWELIRVCLKGGQHQDLSEAKQKLEKAQSDSSQSDSPKQKKEAGKSELLCSSKPFSNNPFVEQGIQMQSPHMGEGEFTLSASAPPWEGDWAEHRGLPLSAPGLPAQPFPVSGRRSFHARTWSQLRAESPQHLAFPVLADPEGNPFYQPLGIKLIKNLKEAVTTYGPNAPFTQALIESFCAHNMTPTDWAHLARACLTPGQFMDWKSWNEEFCSEQADLNAQRQNARWNKDMLTGQGRMLIGKPNTLRRFTIR